MQFFLSCDWGSSTCRLRLVLAEERQIAAQVRSDRGASVITAELGASTDSAQRAVAFATHLDEMIEALANQCGKNLDDLPVVISGMATSAHGWRELPYATVPFAVNGSDLVYVEEECSLGPRKRKHKVFFLSGLRTEDDVIRGEECEIVGLFRCEEWRGYQQQCIIVLPGTHSKHVTVRAGKVASFRTYMTGELFHVLLTHSVLRYTARADSSNVSDTSYGLEQDSAFRAGVRTARADGLSASIFRVRTNGLFGRFGPQANAHFLSGVLIGSELLNLLPRLQREGPVVLCGPRGLQRAYEIAFSTLDASSFVLPVPPATSETAATAGHIAFLESRGLLPACSGKTS